MTRNYKQPGFTIVELLIVIVVIAILAAITIVAYNGIQNRAKAGAAQSALSQANKKILAYTIDNADMYPVALGANGIDNLAALGITNGDTTYQYSANNTTSPRTFCLTATNGNQSYYLSSSVSTPTSGACAGHGANGVAAITNLATDPRATSYSATAIGFRSGRWSTDTAYSLVTGASDGPFTWIPTYARATSTASGGSGRGFHNTTNNPETTNPTAPNGGDLPVTAGTNYMISEYVRSSATRNVILGVRFADSGTSWVGGGSGAFSAPVSATANSWVRISFSVTAPTGATRAAIYTVYASGATWSVGDKLDATALMITEGTTLYGYSDGFSSGWAWNGSSNNATSSGPPL